MDSVSLRNNSLSIQIRYRNVFVDSVTYVTGIFRYQFHLVTGIIRYQFRFITRIIRYRFRSLTEYFVMDSISCSTVNI